MKKIRDDFDRRNRRDSRRKDKAETLYRRTVRKVKTGELDIPVTV